MFLQKKIESFISKIPCFNSPGAWTTLGDGPLSINDTTVNLQSFYKIYVYDKYF